MFLTGKFCIIREILITVEVMECAFLLTIAFGLPGVSVLRAKVMRKTEVCVIFATLE